MHPPTALFIAAAQASPWEQLQRVPRAFWINLAICVIGVLVLIKLWRGLKAFNELAPYLVALVMIAIVFLYWVYDRTEPAFLTPLVEKIAPFFPSKTLR